MDRRWRQDWRATPGPAVWAAGVDSVILVDFTAARPCQRAGVLAYPPHLGIPVGRRILGPLVPGEIRRESA